MNSEELFRKTLDQIMQDPLVRSALTALEQLPKDLRYHTYQHTRDVLHEAVRFAVVDGRTPEEVLLIGIAAAFHDAGYLKQRNHNEPIGAAMARAAMEQDKRFSPKAISSVEQMILDSQLCSTDQGLRQVASIPLSGYLLDADMSNLGREDFVVKWDLLRLESGESPRAFLRQTLDLLKAHSWNTRAARELRDKRKQENIRLVERLVTKETSTL